MEFFRKGTLLSVTDIAWDTDDETEKANELPFGITLTLGEQIELSEGGCLDEEEITDMVAEYLSDEYGFCHNGFTLYITTPQ